MTQTPATRSIFIVFAPGAGGLTHRLEPTPDPGEGRELKNNGTGTLTVVGKIDGIGYQIDGNDTLDIAAGESACMRFDGVQWNLTAGYTS